jgi:hypothetical protein
MQTNIWIWNSPFIHLFSIWILLCLKSKILYINCSGGDLEVQYSREIHSPLLSKAQQRETQLHADEVGISNPLRICNARQPEWWAFIVYHGSSAVFRQQLMAFINGLGRVQHSYSLLSSRGVRYNILTL